MSVSELFCLVCFVNVCFAVVDCLVQCISCLLFAGEPMSAVRHHLSNATCLI